MASQHVPQQACGCCTGRVLALTPPTHPLWRSMLAPLPPPPTVAPPGPNTLTPSLHLHTHPPTHPRVQVSYKALGFVPGAVRQEGTFEPLDSNTVQVCCVFCSCGGGRRMGGCRAVQVGCWGGWGGGSVKSAPVWCAVEEPWARVGTTADDQLTAAGCCKPPACSSLYCHQARQAHYYRSHLYSCHSHHFPSPTGM